MRTIKADLRRRLRPITAACVCLGSIAAAGGCGSDSVDVDSVLQNVDISLPDSASNVVATCDDAFMDQTCFLRFEVPGADADALATSWEASHERLRRAHADVLRARLEAMNPEWAGEAIERGRVTPGPSQCVDAELLLDETESGTTAVFVADVQC